MKKIKNILLTVYCFFLALAGLVYVSGEFFEIDLAWLSESSATMNYVIQMVMILVTLGQIPLALRLFKFRMIHNELVSNQISLLKWGLVRILLLGVPLITNTLLYYFYAFEPAYGYLAVITLLSMVFILPTSDRCESETTEEPITEEDGQLSNDAELNEE
jgi:membrane protease YdiL (CAAX protease family)